MKNPRSLLFLAVLVSGPLGYVLGGHQTAPGDDRLDSPPAEQLREEVARLGRQVLDLRSEREALTSQLVMIVRAVRDDPTKAVEAVQGVLSLADYPFDCEARTAHQPPTPTQAKDQTRPREKDKTRGKGRTPRAATAPGNTQRRTDRPAQAR